MKRVTVITCTLELNRDYFETLRSIKSQKGVDLETITVLPKTHSQRNRDFDALWTSTHRVRYQNGKGIYNAMNSGIDDARGDYCLFLNAGDLFVESSSLQTILRRVEPSIWGYGRIVTVSTSGRTREYFFEPFSVLKLKSSVRYVPHPATLVNTQSLRDLGGFDEELGVIADQDLAYKLSKLEPPRISAKRISLFFLGGVSTRSPSEISANYKYWLKSKNEKILLSPKLNSIILFMLTILRWFKATTNRIASRR